MPFSFFKGKLADGSPFFGIFDEKCVNFRKKHSFPWALQIEIAAKDLQENRLPTGPENHVLNAFEGSLQELLAKSTKYVFFGHVTGGGGRTMYCYLPRPNPAHDVLTSLCEGNPLREMRFEIQHDPEWSRVADIAPA